ncbi:phage Gp37/Gp68 family protein [Candidatus Bathyarchaeota archaeon]|nr:phage Gp37/Gp68 family protein [Candidatus Bathyarchaeota archaeon]
MNKTKIEWTNYSWNPITGCKHDCWYCYAKKLFIRFHRSFEPCFHPERLKEPYELKKPARIFVCSVADLFASWTPREWTAQVLDSMLWCPTKHMFQMLTKNPERINLGEIRPKYPDNWWFGATVSTQEECWRIDALRQVDGNRFISFEPLLGEIEPDLHDIDWVIVGKLTGARKVKMNFSWLAGIMDETGDQQIPLFMKNNLRQAFPDLRLLQEFPSINTSQVKKEN